MQLKDFLPDIANQNSKLVEANKSLDSMYKEGFMSFAKSMGEGNSSSAVSHFGIEQLYFDWLRTAYAYRRMFIQDLYLLAMDSAEIRTPLIQIKGAVFRKGFEDWIPKFVSKCNDCGNDFSEMIKECPICGSENIVQPDKNQYRRFDAFRKNCNIFGQSLEEILNMVSDDVNIVDDAFIFLNRQYIKYEDKLYSKLIEVRRLHPALVEFDLNKEGLPKSSHWLCPFHREKNFDKSGECPICKFKLVPAMYVYNHRGQRIYLFEEEIIHFSKFSPSETYGYSPLLTVMQKVLTVTGMDRFLYRYFFERKTPTGMILTSTDDPQSLEKEKARIEARMQEDPTFIPWVAVSQKSGRGRTDFIRLFHTLQEMDYLPVRNEIRDRIAGIYGVPQMYMNVMEGVGGLSGQSQQLKLFNDVIEAEQRRYNEKVIPILLQAFGITDWVLHLRPPEGKVESVSLQLAQQKVGIASQMRMMGFDVSIRPQHDTLEKLDFQFSLKPVNMLPQGAGGYNPQVNSLDGSINQNNITVDENGVPIPNGMHIEEDGRPPHLENQRHDSTREHKLEQGIYADNEDDLEEEDDLFD